jgi:hypothetical protein
VAGARADTQGAFLALGATGMGLREAGQALLAARVPVAEVVAAVLTRLREDPLGTVQAVAGLAWGRRDADLEAIGAALAAAGVHPMSVALAPLQMPEFGATVDRRLPKAQLLLKRLWPHTGDYTWHKDRIDRFGTVALAEGDTLGIVPSSARFSGGNALPEGLVIGGTLQVASDGLVRLPERLTVQGGLDLMECPAWDRILPPEVKVVGAILCSEFPRGVSARSFREAMALVTLCKLAKGGALIRALGFDSDAPGLERQLRNAVAGDLSDRELRDAGA